MKAKIKKVAAVIIEIVYWEFYILNAIIKWLFEGMEKARTFIKDKKDVDQE